MTLFDELTTNMLGISQREERLEADEGNGVKRRFIQKTNKVGMGPDGNIHDETIHTICLLDCGHDPSQRPPFGKCGVCGGWVCEECFAICEQCGKPICRAHRKEVQGRFYCLDCHGSLRFTKGLKSIGQSMLLIVADKETDHDKR